MTLRLSTNTNKIKMQLINAKLIGVILIVFDNTLDRNAKTAELSKKMFLSNTIFPYKSDCEDEVCAIPKVMPGQQPHSLKNSNYS